ncbi:hypothetical protein C3B58_12645 [Lactonifactor longoviformis]|uniref:Phage tail tube protein n=1 Tax=Lactonifactor longoviformis DSM 17459 TaxID=1122155 RepID=A0A1M5CXW9_9CLOT|nr:hypothetical protein [Lactonifactor longoviformis]POP32279.1 hypothetical protein C3B58_12645 [Lactonifactor longoviformis]SHF59362.1 hypothetical protein SAMN02745158_04328 [Lactonifactor longoviformis DSM 17459]
MPQPIVINGVTMPTLKKEGLTITKEKIWSKNTGRAADASMIGDIAGYKYKLQCQWPPLSRSEAAIIDAAVTPAFFNVTFLDPGSNARITRMFYAGTPTYPVYSYANGTKTYQGVAVDLIEK